MILGIIGEEPINPYAIVRLINKKRRNVRRNIHAQTVYGIINTLNAKKLITGKKIPNGNMPNKTVYSITKKGKELIRKNVMSYLSAPENSLSELALSMMLVGYLDKETVLQALNEYRSKAEEELIIRKKLGSFDIPEEAYIREIAVEHTLNILEVNVNTINKLIKKVKKDRQWNNFTVPWWRNEYFQNESTEEKRNYRSRD